MDAAKDKRSDAVGTPTMTMQHVIALHRQQGGAYKQIQSPKLFDPAHCACMLCVQAEGVEQEVVMPKSHHYAAPEVRKAAAATPLPNLSPLDLPGCLRVFPHFAWRCSC